jgi:hypothetical protein
MPDAKWMGASEAGQDEPSDSEEPGELDRTSAGSPRCGTPTEDLTT